MTVRPILVPRLGITVTEVTLLSWAVPAGTAVTEGDVIALIETDKVESEIEAPTTGTLAPTAEAGEVYAVGTIIGEILES